MAKDSCLSRKILIALAVIVGVFCAIEVAARIYLNYFADDDHFKRYASLKQSKKRLLKFVASPHTYLGYCPTPNFSYRGNKNNSLGFRGGEIKVPKPKNEFRIVCTGGSTTYDSNIDDYRLAYPVLLETDLKKMGFKDVSVVNAGCAGWSSWELLVDFQFRVLDINPDMVIIYSSVNDIHPRLVWPPSAYKSDNSGARAPLISQVFMPSIFEYSTVLRMLMIKMGFIKSHADLDISLVIRPDTFYAYKYIDQKRLHTYPDGIFKIADAEKMFSTNKLIYFERNLESNVMLAQERNITVVLATFAYLPPSNDLPRSCPTEYSKAIDELNNIVRQVAARRGVYLFDFAKKFPPDPRYYEDAWHLTVEGNRVKAELFANYLKDNGLIR